MDVEKTIEFLLSSQAKHDERLERLEVVVEKLADNMIQLAESGIKAQKSIDDLGASLKQLSERTDEVGRRLDESRQRSDEMGRRLDERIDKMVSALGVVIQRLPPNAN